MSPQVKVEIVKATPEHARQIADNPRPADVDELWAASYETPYNAILKGIQRSDQAMTGLINDVPVCMWGAVP